MTHLVVTRKVGQELFIGDDITVTFVEQRDGAIRLGIDAPDDVLILRDDAGPKRSVTPEPKPESVSDVLPSLDVRKVMKAEEDSLAEKYGGAEGPDQFDPIFDPRRKDV